MAADDDGTAPFFEGYDQVELLGRGGMATVWKARQIALDRPVAVKVLNPDQCRSDEDIDRFQSEARAAARMSHPGIVQVYDAFYRDGRFCFVMEFVDGFTVGSWIRRDRVLSEKDALFVADGVAAALRYAWERQRLVHCDVKPDNVMIDADGTVKVMDFGLSRSLCSLQARRAAEGEDDEYVFGTPAYMAPEQATGDDSLSVQADMYALGALLYHAATGRRLFHDVPTEEVMSAQVNDQDEAPGDRNIALSPPFCDFVERLLAKNPEDRFADWGAVVDAIVRVRAGRPFREGPLDPDRQPSTVRHCSAAGRPRVSPPPDLPDGRDGDAGQGTEPTRRRARIRIGAGLGEKLAGHAAPRRRTASPFVALLVFSSMFLAFAFIHAHERRIDYANELKETLNGIRAADIAGLADYRDPLALVARRLDEIDRFGKDDPKVEAFRDDFLALSNDLSRARTARAEATLLFLQGSLAYPGPERGLPTFQGPWDRRGFVRRGAHAAADGLRRYAGPFALETGAGRTNAASAVIRSGKVR